MSGNLVKELMEKMEPLRQNVLPNNEAPFSDFYGDNINGIWQLKIKDIGGQLIEGTLNSWNLVINNAANESGFRARNISGAPGFEANSLNGFKATSNIVGFSSTGGNTAFSSMGSVIGLSTTASDNGVIATAPTAGQFNGDLNYPGLLNGLSDTRLKNIIDVAEEEMLPGIMQLSLHTYTYKIAENEKLNLPSGRQYGVMAQELQKIFPELVNPIELPVASEDGRSSEEKIEYLGVNHIGLVPILVKGVQELASENERLKDENLAIKVRLARLETIILNHAE